MVDTAVANPDLAGGRRFQPRDDPQERGLAAAGGPEEDHEFLILDRHVDRVKSGECAE
jgi:hypothetical protein